MNNKILKLTTLLGVLFGPINANAVPILYEITFEATDLSPAGGTGSFFWDDSTQLIDTFIWNFDGLTGGYDTTTFDWSETVFAGTASTYLFEILTGQDVDPSSCPNCGFGRAAFGQPAGRMDFRRLSSGVEYQFFLPDLQTRSSTGLFSVQIASNQPTAAPEPATLLLLGLGLAGLGVARRKR